MSRTSGRLLLALVASLLALLPAAGAAAAPPYAGRPLEAALLDLQASGVRLVFTSTVVTPEMRVAVEPAGATPSEVLAELLRPHGLTTVPGPGGALMVVRAPAAAAPTSGSGVAGEVRGRDGALLAGAEVAVEEGGARTATDAAGRFALDLTPGGYTLEISAPGRVPQELAVSVAAGHRTELAVTLSPVPTAVEEIDVTTSRWTFLGEGPSTLVIDREQLRSLPNLADDPYRSLTLFPGATGNDVSSRFNVRGALTGDVMVRIDGLEVLEPYHLPDFGGAFSILDPAAVGSVELERGGYRADSGERMGGVVDLTTATPARAQSQLGASLVNLEASRANLLGGGKDDGDGAEGGGRGSYFASLRAGSLQPAFEVGEGDFNPSFADTFLKVERRLGEGRTLFARLLHSRNQLDFTAGDETLRRFDTRYRNSYAWADYEALLPRDRLLAGRASFSLLDRDRDGAESDPLADLELRDRRQLEIGGGAASWSERRSDRLQLRTGLEARLLDADYDFADQRRFADPLAAIRTRPANGEGSFTGGAHGAQIGVWASSRFRPAPALDLELGARIDHSSFTDERHFSPRFNLAWQPRTAAGEGLGTVRLAWGLFYQSQRPDELQVADGDLALYLAERTEQRIVGYERDLGGPTSLVLRLEAYQYRLHRPRPRYENLFQPLTFLPELAADRVRIAPQSGRSEGVELFLRGVGGRGVAGRRIDWWLGTTWSQVTDRIDGRDVPRSVDQPWSVQAGLNVRTPWRWDFYLGWRWHTGWPTTAIGATVETLPDGTAQIVPVLGPLYDERLPAYGRLDLKASRPFALRRGELELYVELQNALNQRNVAGFEIGFAPTPDGGVEVVRERQHWTGVLPLAGVRWRF